MKYLLALLMAYTLLACTETQSDKTSQRMLPDQEDRNLDWMVGTWERTNDKSENKTFEYWKKTESGEYDGVGYTLKGKDTVFKENLRLIKRNDIWTYEVTGVNEEPTLFRFTTQTKQGFVCENAVNKFPKKIDYQLEKDKLVAIISGGAVEIQFLFNKISSK